MITKEQYIESLLKEIAIVKHLAGKVDATKLDYRPTEKQRSTLELMQYIANTLMIGVPAYIAGDQNKYMELAKSQPTITPENFMARMDEVSKFVSETIGALTDEDMKKESTIWGTTATLAVHLLGVLKTFTAYKLQLFLYIKQSGNPNIGTSNVWAGMDMPAQS
jgi:hypothetical protein